MPESQNDLESCTPESDYGPSLISTDGIDRIVQPLNSSQRSSDSPIQSFAASVKSKAATIVSKAKRTLSKDGNATSMQHTRYSVTKMRYGTNLSPHADEYDEKSDRRRLIIIGLMVLAVVLVVAIISVAVIIFGGADSGSGGSSSPSNVAREQALDKILLHVSSRADFADPTTPQSKARNWLLYEDTLWMHPVEPVPGERVIQRYILGVLYFATEGPTTWSENNWLEGDECRNDDGKAWVGVACNDDGAALTIAFGK